MHSEKYKKSMVSASKLVKELGVNILIINIPQSDYQHDSYNLVDIMLGFDTPTYHGSWMPSNDRGYWYDQDRSGCDYKIHQEVEFSTLLSAIHVGGE